MFKKKPQFKIEAGRDCKDFVGTCWSKRYCIKSQECDYQGQGYLGEDVNGMLCTGIKENKIKKEEIMKLFELKGTLRFHAKDLDDAFKRIGEHYLEISSKGVDARGLGESGTDMKLRLIEKEVE